MYKNNAVKSLKEIIKPVYDELGKEWTQKEDQIINEIVNNIVESSKQEVGKKLHQEARRSGMLR